MNKNVAPALVASVLGGLLTVGCQPSNPDVVVTPSSPAVVHDKVPVPGPTTIIHDHSTPPPNNTTVVVPPANNTPAPPSTGSTSSTSTTTTQTHTNG